MTKKNKFKKIASNFFEDEKPSKEENEISLKTLVIVFVIGLIIIFGLYFFSNNNQLDFYEKPSSNPTIPINESKVNITIKNLEGNNNLYNLNLTKENNTKECFFKYDFVKEKEMIVYGLQMDSREEFPAIRGWGEIEIPKNINPLEIKSIITILKSNNPTEIAFQIGNEDKFTEKVYFPITRRNEWTSVDVDITSLVKEDYYYFGFEGINSEIIYLKEAFLCK